MSRLIADDPSPATLRKRRQRERERSEARAAKLAEDIAEPKRVASLPPKRVETSRTIKNSTLHVSTHYTLSPTMTVPEDKPNGHAAAETITSKPPQVRKYITIEISPPALDAMVERGFLAAGRDRRRGDQACSLGDVQRGLDEHRAGPEGLFAGAGRGGRPRGRGDI